MNDEQTPALREAVKNMANMREAYNNLSQAAEAYNTGKAELAANITAKGVQASATETLPELAEKVSAIAQESYTIDGGEMYAKQLFGSLETPNYWNLYEVLANLLSDGRLVQYGGILLAEYYRGYDSLALAGADTGGAYVVSDKDENGQFKMYTEDTTHTWATEFDGKGNRWVAYCFADEYHDFQITDTNTSPRSIFIGRKVGTIKQLANSRTSQIVVPDENELRMFNPNGFTNKFGKFVKLKLSGEQTNTIINNEPNLESVYLEVDKISNMGTYGSDAGISGTELNCIIVKANQATNTISTGKAHTVIYEIEEILNGSYNNPSMYGPGTNDSTGKLNIIFIGIERGQLYCRHIRPLYVYFGYKTNDKSRTISFPCMSGTPGANPDLLTDIELQNGWCKTISLTGWDYLTEENMYAHILQRLKQDEPDCGADVTITLGSTNLAKLTSQESQDLLASLRGTYGYTFA